MRGAHCQADGGSLEISGKNQKNKINKTITTDGKQLKETNVKKNKEN